MLTMRQDTDINNDYCIFMADKISPNLLFRLALKHIIERDWDRRQKVLAAESGIKDGTLSQIKKGTRNASPEKQAAIAEAAGYNLEKFLALGRELHEQSDSGNHEQAANRKGVVEINGAGQAIDLKQYVAESGLGPAMWDAIDKLKTIYKSGDDVIIRAIGENLNAFVRAVDYRQKVQDLEDGQNQIRKELGGKIRHLEGIIEGLLSGTDARKKRRS